MRYIIFLSGLLISLSLSVQAFFDPIQDKREQIIAKIMEQQHKAKLQAAQKKTMLKQTPVSTKRESQPSAARFTPKVLPKIPASSVPAVKAVQVAQKPSVEGMAPMVIKAWKAELNVPNTSNEGIEILPHPID